MAMGMAVARAMATVIVIAMKMAMAMMSMGMNMSMSMCMSMSMRILNEHAHGNNLKNLLLSFWPVNLPFQIKTVSAGHVAADAHFLLFQISCSRIQNALRLAFKTLKLHPQRGLNGPTGFF